MPWATPIGRVSKSHLLLGELHVGAVALDVVDQVSRDVGLRAVTQLDLQHTVMAYVVMAYAVMAYMIMAYAVMAYVVMGYIIMAYVVMAYVVMA